MSFVGSRTTPSTLGQGVAYRELDSSNNTTPRTTNTAMYSRDWRTALRTPPTYRIGNRTLRFNYHFGLLLVGVGVLFVLFFYVRTGSQSSSDVAWLRNSAPSVASTRNGDSTQYNSTYPLTPPIVTAKGGTVSYRLGMIADLDQNSQLKKDDGSLVWRSYLKKGYLIYSPQSGSNAKADIKIRWDVGEPIALESSFSLKGRGMELSELVTFNGKLLTFDDRTGLIYELSNDKVLPWVILMDGNGHNAKGFKSEWATVQRQTLFVGSMGKEWTTSQGEFQNENPMFVKAVSTAGTVTSLDWSFYYKLLRQESMQIQWPGYMLHESGVWSDAHQKWYFLPRRCSKEQKISDHWIILGNTNGSAITGFKSEWAAVVNETLFVGSTGKMYTNEIGQCLHDDQMFVRTITKEGIITIHDWRKSYKRIRKCHQGIVRPGYVWHEAGVWSELHKKWYFLPRKCSKEMYNETRDEYMGCNVLISADERFTKVDTVELDPLNTAPTHGFSSFKFIPGTDDRIILAIKSEELNGKTSTFITAFDIGGKTILPETQIDTNYKYEGIEFI